MRAREIRGEFAFGEEILDIADNTADDWSYNPETGKLSVNKEAMLRSKIRIEARQFHMSRLHPQWGEKQIDVKNDWALLTEEQRRRKADELIAMIREMREPPMQPPPLVYRPEEAPDEPVTGGFGCQPRPRASSNFRFFWAGSHLSPEAAPRRRRSRLANRSAGGLFHGRRMSAARRLPSGAVA
jgi:hypothetical protein